MNLQQELAALRARIDELEAQAAKAKTEADDSWPKIGEAYFYIDCDGDIGENDWEDDGLDARRFAIGNAYRTKEEAKREVERRKVLTELRKLANASWIKWPVTHAYYSFRVFNGEIDICAYSYRRNELGVVYFATEKAAEAAIETIGADRLMLLMED